MGWAQGRLDAALSRLRAANDDVTGMAESLGAARDEVASLEPADDAQRVLQQQVVSALDEQVSLLEGLASGQASALDELQGISNEVSDGAKSVDGLATSVNDAVQAGTGSIDALRTDLATGAAPELSSALDALADAGGRLAGGTGSLVPMIEQADAGLAQLDALLAQSQSTLADTADSLRAPPIAWARWQTTSPPCRAPVPCPPWATSSPSTPASTGAALGSPVQMVDEPVFPVANYGSGVAPFYTNLALWVGGFVLVAIYKLEVDREGLGDVEVTPTQAFFGRWLLLALLGQVQALTCCVGDLALGVQCVSPVAFVLAGMAASLVYVLVVYSLAVALKHVGKALAVLLVVLQIPGASGLYPIQMQPAFFRALGPWLPFTYGIGAMREAVAGFYGTNYARDLAVLALFAVPALLLGVVARRRLLGQTRSLTARWPRTDLLVTERDGEKDAGRLALLVDALASSPAHREAFHGPGRTL